MKRRMRFPACFAALLMLICASCGSDENKAGGNVSDMWENDSTTLRIAVTPTIDCLPLFLAEDCGLFERQGVDVSLYLYNAQMDCDTAFCNGRVTGMTSDLVRTEWLKQKGMKIKYLTATDLHWQLIGSKMARVKKLNQLEHKMIAMTRFSATALLADKLVDSSGVVNEHVFRIQVNDVNLRLKMLETQVMDAMLLPEPQATGARRLNGTLLYDTHWNDVCLGVLAIREPDGADTLLISKADALLKAYDEACDSLNSRGLQAYRELIVKRCSIRPEVVDSLSPDIHFSASHQPRQQDVDLAIGWLNKYIKVKDEKKEKKTPTSPKRKKAKRKN